MYFFKPMLLKDLSGDLTPNFTTIVKLKQNNNQKLMPFRWEVLQLSRHL